MTSVLAAAAANPQLFNVNGMSQVLEGLIGVGVLVVAIAMVVRAGSRNFGAVVASLAILIIGLLVFGIAHGGHIGSIGDKLANIIF
jgi:hypothetical protein